VPHLCEGASVIVRDYDEGAWVGCLVSIDLNEGVVVLRDAQEVCYFADYTFIYLDANQVIEEKAFEFVYAISLQRHPSP
jgi:hypothetical protein